MDPRQESEIHDSDAITPLALDLNWSWSHSADEIWKRLDPELWELIAHPCSIIVEGVQHEH